jgi:hypothetical protein
MCHGDVGMITYQWENDSKRPKASVTAHQCIDYNRLVEWTNERTIDMVKPGFLIHPTLGKPLIIPVFESALSGCVAGPVYDDDQNTGHIS